MNNKEKYFKFLDTLKGKNIVNEMEFAYQLSAYFDIDRTKARKVWIEWRLKNKRG